MESSLICSSNCMPMMQPTFAFALHIVTLITLLHSGCREDPCPFVVRILRCPVLHKVALVAIICYNLYKDSNRPGMGGQGVDTVAALYCSCEHQIWGEFWWVGGKYKWMFFDDQERSETYTE